MDASLQKLLIGNQKCKAAAATIDNNMNADMIHMYLPFFTGDTKSVDPDELTLSETC